MSRSVHQLQKMPSSCPASPGKSAKTCPALFEKIFRFSETANQVYIRSHPVPHGGALRNVTNEERGAVDADGATDERAGSGRRRRVVLMPRRWHQVGGNIRKRRWQESPVTGESAL